MTKPLGGIPRESTRVITVAMNPRPTEDNKCALHGQTERDDSSKNEVLNRAVADYVTSRPRATALHTELGLAIEEHRELLHKLR